jgi:transcriptional regulator with XRE-family HTH domain
MTVGDRIRSERERLGHTQDEWARHVGIHRNTQAKYERGEATPDIGYLSAIDELCADIDFIRTGERRKWMSLAEAIDRECVLISGIVECVETSALSLEVALSPEKKGRVVAMLYRAFHHNWDIIPSVVAEAVKLAAD